MSEPRESLLISRVIDREATPSEWAELEARARRDPSLLENLVRSMRQDAELRGAVSNALGDEADLPDSRTVEPSGRRGPLKVAAAVLLAVTAGFVAGLVSDGRSPRGAAPLSEDVPDGAAVSVSAPAGGAELLQNLPNQIVRVRAVEGADGEVEIVYVRRVLERRVVPKLFGVGRDDTGEPVPTPASVSRLTPPQSM